MAQEEMMYLVNRSLFATIGYLDEDGKQNARRVFCVWHKGLGKHLIEFLSDKHPLQTSNS